MNTRIAYWLGRLEEADRQINFLQAMKSPTMRVRLALAKKLREEAKSNIAKLSGADEK